MSDEMAATLAIFDQIQAEAKDQARQMLSARLVAEDVTLDEEEWDLVDAAAGVGVVACLKVLVQRGMLRLDP